MKYSSLEELRAGFAAGELDDSVAVIDNDSVSVYQEDKKVYESHPSDLLRDALTLLGIPWESA